MALSPSIPTSFVPKQAPQNQRRMSSGNNLLMVIGVIVFVIAVVVAAGIFFYGSYLKGVENTKSAQLVQQQKSVSQDTVQQFIKLQNRLTAAKTLVSNHVELSQFFNLLESDTLQNVRFNSLTLKVNSDSSGTLRLGGQARNFNALAAESKAFAAEPLLKSAIFSNISIDPKTGNVTFGVTATVDERVIVEAAPPANAGAAAATSTTTVPQTSLPTLPPVTQATSSTKSAAAGTVGTTTNKKP